MYIPSLIIYAFNRSMVTGLEVWSVDHLPLLFFQHLEEAVVFYSCLVDLRAKNHGTAYSKTLSLLCCSISFCLFCVLLFSCLSSRTIRCLEHPSTSAELCLAEAHIDSST